MNLIAFCPNELFTNTKADLGNCLLDHDPKHQAQYKTSTCYQKHPWERTFYDKISKLMNDIDRQVRRGRERLNTKAPGETADVKDEQVERIVMIEKKIQELVEKVEAAGDEGKVEEAKQLMIESEKHKIELDLVKKGEDPLSQAERRMEVCEVCGILNCFILDSIF